MWKCKACKCAYSLEVRRSFVELSACTGMEDWSSSFRASRAATGASSRLGCSCAVAGSAGLGAGKIRGALGGLSTTFFPGASRGTKVAFATFCPSQATSLERCGGGGGGRGEGEGGTSCVINQEVTGVDGGRAAGGAGVGLGRM